MNHLRSAPQILALLALAAPVGCGARASDPPEPVAETAEAVWGGQDDADTPEADVVVEVYWPKQCSGTLITPGVVLTANHCVNPAVTSGDVWVGAKGGQLTHYPATGALYMAAMPSGLPDDRKGLDVALVFLGAPVLSQAKIERPSLTAPTWPGDVNGGKYPGLIGFAGWSPYARDDKTSVFVNRQAVIFSGIQLEHEPVNGGQEWMKGESVAGITRGDSGGPLFAVRTDAGCAQRADCNTRDVLGVASYYWTDLWGNSSAHWTDVTRGAPRQWILDHVVDHSHDGQTRWLSMHPPTVPGTVTDANGNLVEKWRETTGPRWIGEVDYTGACQPQFDRDCDHWYDEHDNCPREANTDQADSLGSGVGDACRFKDDPSWGPSVPVAAQMGIDTDGSPLYACRARLNGTLQPGKMQATWSACDVGYGGQERWLTDYQILQSGQWTDAAGGAIPRDGVWFGNETGNIATPFFVCRANHAGSSLQPGKLREGLGGCDYAYGGAEITAPAYSVMTGYSMFPVARQWQAVGDPLPLQALKVGFDDDGAGIYSCIVPYAGGWQLGKTERDWKMCDISYGGQEIWVDATYRILSADLEAPDAFVAQNDYRNVFVAGKDLDGAALGICVADYAGGTQVGKYKNGQTCNFGYGGAEVVLTSGFRIFANPPSWRP